MSLPRVSLSSFLSSAKTALLSAPKQASPVTFVIGNESADLDSLCCAVVLAYLRTYTSTSRSLYIPLSNIPQEDLSLRPELATVLSHANLKSSDLITLSDLPTYTKTSPQLKPEKTSWILVDHNALQGELGRLYGSRVIGCIDHHDEENKVPKACGNEPRVVQKSGSCASLVVEYCREAWDSLSKGKPDNETTKWDAELARVALGPILIDTTNLTSKAKTTEVDTKAVKYLEGLVKAEEGNSYNSDEYFKLISEAKQDIGRLSLNGILRKDYKQWAEGNAVNLGISSVVKNITFLLEKAGDEKEFSRICLEFAKERDLSICSIMTTSNTDGAFKRELLVWALDEKGVKAAKKFEADASEKLELRQWNNGALDLDTEGQWRRCWWQDKTENSRKQVAPLLRTSVL